MSDVMLIGVLRMPLPDDPAELDVMDWLQFRDRARQAADRIEADAELLKHAAWGLELAMYGQHPPPLEALQWYKEINAAQAERT
tara:strand:+ start:199 stop:450 length:252 start_codon:yes stop_codon:yes gene_type:complete